MNLNYINMAKTSDIAIGAAIGATLGAIVVIVGSTRTGREVLKAAAKPAPRKTVIVKRKRSFWDLFDEPDIYIF
jgi:gas vesicle protein